MLKIMLAQSTKAYSYPSLRSERENLETRLQPNERPVTGWWGGRIIKAVE